MNKYELRITEQGVQHRSPYERQQDAYDAAVAEVRARRRNGIAMSPAPRWSKGKPTFRTWEGVDASGQLCRIQVIDRRGEPADNALPSTVASRVGEQASRSFLITWNPKSWEWTSLAAQAVDSSLGKIVEDRWSCGNRKDIHPGDRLFLIRLGEEPRGIMGSGWATTPVFREAHWDEERAQRGDLANYVRLRFETLLDPTVDEILPVTSLRSRTLTQVKWNSQASGILIQAEAARDLELVWSAHLRHSAAFDDEVSALEGDVRRRLIFHRRRERSLRAAKIASALRKNGGRLVCEVPGCQFDFWAVYGEIGRNYAQVHHLEPLGQRSQPRRTSLNDLAVVCANCHAMIHVGGACRDIESLIVRSKGNPTAAELP